jgi:hypothetical protein
LVTADLASLPDGVVGLSPLLMLFGEGETLVVGAAFCAPAMVIPTKIAAAAASVMSAFIFRKLHSPFPLQSQLASPRGVPQPCFAAMCFAVLCLA